MRNQLQEENAKTSRLNNMLLNNQWANKEIKEIKYLWTNENGNNGPKSLRHNKESSMRKDYSNTGLAHKIKSKTIYTPKGTKKKRVKAQAQ